MAINETHDPNLKSWVESANDPGTEFPIQNLPIVAFWRDESAGLKADVGIGVAIGDHVLDLSRLTLRKDLDDFPGVSRGFEAFFGLGVADSLMIDRDGASAVRRVAAALLNAQDPRLRDDASLRAEVLLPAESIGFKRPATIKNYTDFYASLTHAATVGSMFRPDNPLLPNYKHIPIGYHGRASSIVASGTDVRRPRGQQSPPEDTGQKAGATGGPAFGPCKMLDYELEVGFFVGSGNKLGDPIDIRDAEKHIFGLCLVNDWSARDMQKWEYQPLGPFLAKNFATSISPYIVTMEALEPFRCPAFKRPEGDPRPLPYLFSEDNESRGGVDITLEVHLQSEQMRARGLSPVLLSRSNAFKDMYWTIAQMLTHHASNGCNMQPGDLLASGTVSGPGPNERGCLLEATWDGNDPATGKPRARKPIQLPSGETRLFLADGDEVIFKGYCEKPGFRRIGFGECRGRILPALP